MAIAHAAGAMVAVDSTAASPVFTRPLTLGADFVMHAAIVIITASATTDISRKTARSSCMPMFTRKNGTDGMSRSVSK